MIRMLSAADISLMERTNVLSPSCPVPVDQLRIVRVPYVDFAGHDQLGDIMVLDRVAPQVLTIFQAMHAIGFALEKVKLISDYHGDDIASMGDNNTCAFNDRVILGSDRKSMHAYGLAIDINPMQNPYVPEPGQCLPDGSSQFLDRTTGNPAFAERVVHIFKANGFDIWGGDWQTPIDYQHFQTNPSILQTPT